MFYYDSNRFLKRVSIIFLFLVRHHFSRHLSTLKLLQKRYGNVVVRNVKEFEKIHFKYRKVLLDIDFVNFVFPTRTSETPRCTDNDKSSYLNKRYLTRKEILETLEEV